MRHVLLSVLILALVLTFCIISESAVRSACSQTLQLLQTAQRAAIRKDFSVTQPILRAAEQHWKQHEHFFGVVLRHDETDDVLQNFAALRQYAVTQDLDEFLAVCASLIATISHIQNMSRASYHNILSAGPARGA